MNSIEKAYCKEVRKTRHLFLQSINPYRNELFKFCRSLSKKPWDAEDLVQDTIAKAYSKLSEVWLDGIQNPKAYLFRIATNLWLDQCRRSGTVLSENQTENEVMGQQDFIQNRIDSLEIKDALEKIVVHLPPKERIAIVLKDIFDYTIEDIAIIMETSTGAVKSALFRGRSKIEQIKNIDSKETFLNLNRPSAKLMEQMVHTFNTRNMDGLIALFLEHASGEVYGTVQEWNRDEIRRGSMAHTIFDGSGNPLPQGFPFMKIIELFNERILVIIEKDNLLDDVFRINEEDGKISHFTSYFFCPEVLQEIASKLKLTARTHDYFYYKE